MADEPIKWHDILQDILDHYLPLMSGKKIKEGERELARYFQVDYFCEIEGDLPAEQLPKNIVRPFDHLKARNVIEYKSIHEVVNESLFRHYVSRALYTESPEPGVTHQGNVTLTIMTTRTPETLFSMKEYAIERIDDWKYRSRWIKDLDIYFLVQKQMRGQKAGEALALLQILEGEKERQKQCWQEILSQDLQNVEVLKKIIAKINEEAYMNLVEALKNEGKIEGKIEGVLEALSWTAPELAEKYENRIKFAQTEEELREIEKEIKEDLKR